MSSADVNVYASNICKKKIYCLNLTYESSSQNRTSYDCRSITWSLPFCWFRHAQSATRKYLDELRGSRQILQLHRWQLAPMAHAMWLCEMRLVGILCLWKLFVGLHVLLTVPGFFFWGSTWSCLEDATMNLKCVGTVPRLPVFCLCNQGGFLFFWESKAGVVQYYDMYCMSLYFPHFYMIWFWEEKKLSVLWAIAGAKQGCNTQQNILGLGLVFSVWLVVQTNSTDCQQN